MNEEQDKQGNEEQGESTGDSEAGSTAPVVQRSDTVRQTFFAWLGRQSLPRLLGLLVSDTRALEARIADKDKEIKWLRARLDTRSSSGGSAVSNEEDRASTPVKSLPSPSTVRNVNPILSHALELDLMKERFFYDPQEVLDKVVDLQKNPTPRNKQILNELEKWLDGLKIEDTPSEGGVVIMS